MSRSIPPLFIEDEVAEPKSLLQRLKPWGGSAAVHGVGLVALLLWSIPILQQGSIDLMAFVGNDDEVFEKIAFSLDEALTQDIESETNVEPLASLDLAPDPLMEQIDEPALLPPVDVPSEVTVDETTEQRAVIVPGSQSVGDGSVSDADSIEAAVDAITGGIRGQLGEGDVLVVWLLDASLSLKDDRERVADRLEGFLKELEADAPNRKHRLFNSVVSFGKSISERVAPTKETRSVLRSIRKTPTDRSGVENVFTAVAKCVGKYRSKWKSNMMIVVWTDETGDDSSLLDKTIARCQKGEVNVSVVGPSAVLGREAGLHAYIDPKTKLLYQLPVKRGPDSAMPERIRLRHWHPNRGRNFWRRGGMQGTASWLGGSYMEGISSGFSPYALTRLATSTGGSYTIFDRPEDRAPFDFVRMAEYIPSYVSREEFQRELKKHPLRQAIVKAVEVTNTSKISTPPLSLFGAQTVRGRTVFPYLTPSQFATRLRSSKQRFERIATRYEEATERALAQVSAGGDPSNGGLLSEYEQETSPRWRAWYDLTRGRLLANRVRAHEYRLTCEELGKTKLDKGTNAINLRPTSEMLSSDDEVDRRVEEAIGLLERCVRENRDTPWAYLAQFELANGLGLRAVQMQLSQVKATPQHAPNLPKF